MKVQYIGVDIGRGYVKGYSVYSGDSYRCKFKSVLGRYDEDTELDKDSIVIDYRGKSWLIGEQAESECSSFIANQSSSKITLTAKLLFYAALNEIAVSNTIRVSLGVPNNCFKKSILKEIEEEYKGKVIKIKDLKINIEKEVLIEDITIYRESDAALYYTVSSSPNKKELEESTLGMITVGFRTTELSYFDRNKFNNSRSDTLEVGNRNILEVIQKALKKDGITKKLNEIDTDSRYYKQKAEETKYLLESIHQDVMMKWINYKEMIIFIAGGTTLNFDQVPENFIKVEDAQMVTAKGLFKVAQGRLI